MGSANAKCRLFVRGALRIDQFGLGGRTWTRINLQYSRFAGLVAAHRSLPMGSQVRVVNLDNGRSVVVTIVGRVPFIGGRVIDVSTEAAVALGFRQSGVAHVRIDQI